MTDTYDTAGNLEDMPRLIRTNSFYVLIERAIVPLTTFLISVYIVRKLSIDDFGIYNILFAMTGYVGLLSSLGLPHVFQRYIPEFHEKNELSKMKALVERGLLLRFLLCGFVILIILIFSEQIGRLFQFEKALQYLLYFALGIVFFHQTELLRLILASIFQHKKYVVSQITYVLLRASLISYFLYTGKGLTALLISESVAYIFLFIFLFSFYKGFLKKHHVYKKDILPVRRLIRFGGFSFFYEFGNEILAVSTDFFVISAFLGPVAVGIYAFATRVMHMVFRIMPQTVFVNIIRPVFFTKYSQNKDLKELNKMGNFIIKMNAFSLFPVIAGIFVLGDKLIIYVYDQKYLESLSVLWIVAAFYLIRFLIFPIGMILQAIEKVQIIFYSEIFAVYNLVADLLVIKKYGVIGIALVTGTAVLFRNIFCYIFVWKYTGFKISLISIGKVLINSCVMASVVYFIRGWVVNIPSFILVMLIGFLVYLGLSAVIRVFNNEERKIMNKILPKPIFIF